MSKIEVTLIVNGAHHTDEVEPRLLLVQYLRDVRGLTGSHIGCDTSTCGACTVILDGDAVKSCTVLAVQARGGEVTTIEGLTGPGEPFTPVQQGFHQEHGLQCGYCTPGMIMASTALLAENTDPTEIEIRHALEGNLCRCTGYQTIVNSVRWAAEHPDGVVADAGGKRDAPMIPAAFDYVEAESIEHALSLLGEHEDGKLIAGGHSLVPMMKLRLATPSVLIDIGRIDELSRIEDRGDHVAVGALARHRSVEKSTLLADHVPLLAHVAAQIGDPQVRNRGTMGGSLAHGDPAADLPAAALALRSTMVIAGSTGERREVPAGDFFLGFLETAVAHDEMLVEVLYPKQTAGWNYQKFCRRAMDYAIVGVAVQLGSDPGIALVNMGSVPHFAAAASAALASGEPAARAVELVVEGTEPLADANATEEYRRHLARTLTARALAAAGHA